MTTRIVLALALILLTTLPAGAGTFKRRQLDKPRVAEAWRSRGPALEASFRDAGAAWPPRGVYLRAFKAERVLELWAAPAVRDASWVRVSEIRLCATSGDLGPKRRSGDGQMPEGFYRVDRFNPWSSYHLSLGLDYPNAVDLLRAGEDPPGGDIFIHGDCVTIGCLPIEDGPIEALYLAAVLARDAGQHTIPAHVFPCRLDQAACQDTLADASADDPELLTFWDSLRAGYDRFSEAGVPPRLVAEPDGTYRLLPDGR